MASQSNKGRASEHVATAAEYMRALRSLLPLAPSYIGMLQFHSHQPNRTATAGSVAEAVGFKNFRGTNLHYGRLAGLVGEQLGWRPPKGRAKLRALVTFDKTRRPYRLIMREEVAEALRGLGWVGTLFELMPGEMPEKTQLTEGAVYRVAVNAYERSPKARRMCLAHYGISCAVCGFDFEATYGEAAEGFIHVHHIRALAEIGTEYTIDPVKDLRPLCPNCHSVVHLRTPPYRIDELKAMLAVRGECK